MFLVHLALLHAVTCIDIQIEGNVTFDLRLVNGKRGKHKSFRQGWEAGKKEQERLVLKTVQVRRNVTVAPELECIYQYPEKEQVNALLSNMMNELTKVFVRAHNFTSGVKRQRDLTRREDKRNERATEAKTDNKRDVRRTRNASRFKVVYKKQKAFFEHIYSNMITEYRNFYNMRSERVDRTDRDPCQHQDELKQIWRELLEHSLAMLKRATHRCVMAYLQNQHVDAEPKIRVRLEKYLKRELSTVRTSQLSMLCDIYQLCYNDLLE